MNQNIEQETNNNKQDIKQKDYNPDILKLLQDRMALGLERYGHGLRIHDDTRQWGTKEDSWEEMALEEVLDGLIYTAAAIFRLKEKRLQKNIKE